MTEKKPTAKVRYLVLKNPTYEAEEIVEAHNPSAAITSFAGEEAGTYVAMPARYVKVIEVAPAPAPPVPQMSLTEKDTAEWLARASGIPGSSRVSTFSGASAGIVAASDSGTSSPAFVTSAGPAGEEAS